MKHPADHERLNVIHAEDDPSLQELVYHRIFHPVRHFIHYTHVHGGKEFQQHAKPLLDQKKPLLTLSDWEMICGNGDIVLMTIAETRPELLAHHTGILSSIDRTDQIKALSLPSLPQVFDEKTSLFLVKKWVHQNIAMQFPSHPETALVVSTS